MMEESLNDNSRMYFPMWSSLPENLSSLRLWEDLWVPYRKPARDLLCLPLWNHPLSFTMPKDALESLSDWLSLPLGLNLCPCPWKPLINEITNNNKLVNSVIKEGSIVYYAPTLHYAIVLRRHNDGLFDVMSCSGKIFYGVGLTGWSILWTKSKKEPFWLNSIVLSFLS